MINKISLGLEYKIQNGFAILCSVGSCNDSDIVVPEYYEGKIVASVSDNAFSRCENLISIKLPSSVVSIGKSAFAWCNYR